MRKSGSQETESSALRRGDWLPPQTSAAGSPSIRPFSGRLFQGCERPLCRRPT